MNRDLLGAAAGTACGMTLLVVLGILLILLFGGLGFAAKILWWGIVIGVVLLIAAAVSGRRV